MWIYTPDGFYSSRQDEWCEKDEVMVRSRVYVDLVNLADAIGIENPCITRLDKGDYLYRMKVKVHQWTIYCAHAAMNFDDGPGIKDVEDFDRYQAYVQVWEIMQWLQSLKDAEMKNQTALVKKLRDEFSDLYGWGAVDFEMANNILDLTPTVKKKKKGRKKSNFLNYRRSIYDWKNDR